MSIQIDETLYRSLFDLTLSLVREMTPGITANAIASDKDPAQAVGDSVDGLFRRVLEGYEKLGAFTKKPAQRPASMRPKPRTPFA